MIKEAIAKLVEREDLGQSEAEGVMGEIMRGEATPSQISGFIVALRMKGETIDEIAGCAGSMRASAIRVTPKSARLVDTCGTGGDGAGTFNVSTLAAVVAAGGGLKVAKHGNRSVSSRSGSADLLESLGVKIDLGPEGVARCIDEAGIGFLFAQKFHPAMKYAAPTRKELGIRTIFNILGPLTNPAFATVQLLGVFSEKLTEPLAGVLQRLGSESALVVHGEGGLDELTTTGLSKITRLHGGKLDTFHIDPVDLGLPRATLADLKGGDPAENARTALEILEGKTGPKRDMVLLNTAAVFVAAGTAPHLREGLAIAAESIDKGKAREKLQVLINLSRQLQ
ncbi:MAG: anthranilate phosphoribosyltransferase [Chloroflexi bacterium]|nr:anthranilate phosphoribosyltransferase [Chloroflexota bacterium]